MGDKNKGKKKWAELGYMFCGSEVEVVPSLNVQVPYGFVPGTSEFIFVFGSRESTGKN